MAVQPKKILSGGIGYTLEPIALPVDNLRDCRAVDWFLLRPNTGSDLITVPG
jgi:hypothetical protein